jgi:hypothetical protein
MEKNRRRKQQQKKNKFAETKIPRKSKLAAGEYSFANIHPVFSFRHYHDSDNKFSVRGILRINDFYMLIERLKTMSGLTWLEIKNSGNTYRFHSNEWADTSKKGFPKAQGIPEDAPCWQFKVFDKFRIHGFFPTTDMVFCIVWFDRYHKLRPRK